MTISSLSKKKEVQIALVLWLKWYRDLKSNPEEPTEVNYLDALTLLSEWMIGDEEYETIWSIPTEVGPDICATCCSYFDSTVGGRVRSGCFQCQDTHGSLVYPMSGFAQHFGISEHEAELIFSYAVLNYSKIPANAPKFEEPVTQ